MKRSLVALLLAACLALGACGNRSTPAESAGSAPVAKQETVAPVASATVATENAAEAPAETAAAVANVSEMESDSEAAEEQSAAQPLALRIAETKPAPPSEFKEGVHYARLVPAQPSSGSAEQIEVTEAFWYGCPHCYALDPYLEAWRKQAPSYIKFMRVPVIWNPRTGTHARLFYAAEALGKLEELHSQIFREIHVNNNPLDSTASIEAFFTAHGVTKEEFTRAFSGEAVETQLRNASSLLQRYRIESVPTLVINGKYLTDVGRAGGQKQLINLLNELAARERGV